jgi:hypothetical protein
MEDVMKRGLYSRLQGTFNCHMMDILALQTQSFGSIAAIVRMLRHVPGLEDLTIKRFRAWFNGEEKDLTKKAYNALHGIGFSLRDARLQHDWKVLTEIDQFLKFLSEGSPEVPLVGTAIQMRTKLRPLIATLRHQRRNAKITP